MHDDYQNEDDGEEVISTLERRPSALVHCKIHGLKVLSKDRDGLETPQFRIAEPIGLPIERGLAGPGLLAETVVRRHADHLPLHRLHTFLRDGRIPIHNNGSERELRREALGRKNWLFVGNDDAGEVNATFVPLLVSCEMHGIEPWAYLRDLFCLLPQWPRRRVLELSPARWAKTLEEEHTQELLAADVFRQITLGAFNAQLDRAWPTVLTESRHGRRTRTQEQGVCPSRMGVPQRSRLRGCPTDSDSLLTLELPHSKSASPRSTQKAASSWLSWESKQPCISHVRMHTEPLGSSRPLQSGFSTRSFNGSNWTASERWRPSRATTSRDAPNR